MRSIIKKYGYFTLMYTILIITVVFVLAGCGDQVHFTAAEKEKKEVSPVDETVVVVRGRAQILFSSQVMPGISSMLPQTRSAVGTTTVTYTNVASTSFAISVAGLNGGSFTGLTLNLGSVSLSGLDDNNLKVCNPGGNTKCSNTAIRVYTTGSVAGFVQTTDLYGAPVYVGSLNPSTAIGLTSSGSVNVQTLTIAGNKNRLRLVDFTSPTYTVMSDFSNAGAGPYSMAFVVEYILLP